MNAAMHALSLYRDTSVIGGYYYPEFMTDMRVLWRLRDTGRFSFFPSVNASCKVTRPCAS